MLALLTSQQPSIALITPRLALAPVSYYSLLIGYVYTSLVLSMQQLDCILCGVDITKSSPDFDACKNNMELVGNLIKAGQLFNSSHGVQQACGMLEGNFTSTKLYAETFLRSIFLGCDVNIRPFTA